MKMKPPNIFGHLQVSATKWTCMELLVCPSPPAHLCSPLWFCAGAQHHSLTFTYPSGVFFVEQHGVSCTQWAWEHFLSLWRLDLWLAVHKSWVQVDST